MTILQLDTSTVPNYLSYPANAATRQYLLTDLEMAATKLGLTSPPTQPGGEWDLLAGMFATTADVCFSSLQLSNAKGDPLFAEGDDLDAIRQRLGLPEIAATGATGNVTARVSGPCTFLAGEQCVFGGGLRGAVTATTAFTVAGSGPVPIAMVDTGDATNFPAGTTCKWSSPPLNAYIQATVAADFEGGTDAETDADKRLRVLDALQLPQLYGSLQWIISQVLAFPASQYAGTVVPDQCFVYRAPGGPGTFLVVVMQTGTAANSGARAIPDATLTALRTHLSTLVPPEIHFDVRTAQATSMPTSLSIAFTGARGTTDWADATPWPAPWNSREYVQAVSHDSVHTFTGVDAGAAPASGAKLTVTDGVSYRDLTVSSSSGAPGNYTVIVTETLAGLGGPVMLYPRITTVGTRIEELWKQAMGELACGELIVDARLPQCRRFPSTALGGATASLFGAVKNLETLLGSSVLNVASLTTPVSPGPSAGSWDSPYVLIPELFAVYKSSYS